MASPFGTEDVVDLSASATDDLWAISHARLARFDGAQWTTLADAPPFARGAVNPEATLALYVAARNDVWLLGPDPVRNSVEAMHWDGHAWTMFPLDSPAVVDIGGSAPDDVWAVGYNASVSHWNGQAWSAVTVEHTTDTFTRVAALSRDAAWLVGTNFNWGHWDGQHWKAQAYGPGFFFDVNGSAPDDIWMVGRPEAPQRPPPRFRPIPIAPFEIPTDPNAVYSIQHWDGHHWTTSPGAPAEAVHSVCANTRTRAWASGAAGHAWQWDGSRWTPSETGLRENLGALACLPGGDAWMAGAHGTLLHRGL